MVKSKTPNKVLAQSIKKSLADTGYGTHRLYTGQEEKRRSHQKAGAFVCKNCKAVSYRKHWFIDPHQEDYILADKIVKEILCPGCKRVQEQDYQGEVILDGPSIIKDMDDIVELIKHTEGKCWHYNPASRIASINIEGKKVKIETTTKWLAIRIGKELQKSHKSILKIKPAPDEDFVRVYWTKNLDRTLNKAT